MSAQMLVQGWLEATLAASVMALGVYLLKHHKLGPRWLHFAWSVVLLKFLVPPLLFIASQPLASNTNLIANPTENPVTENVATDPLRFDSSHDSLPFVFEVQSNVADSVVNDAHQNDDSATDPIQPIIFAQFLRDKISFELISEILVTVWAVGLVFCLMVTGRRVARLKSFQKELTVASDEDFSLLAEISQKMQILSWRVPELKISVMPVSPMVLSWGFARRPVLVLPNELWRSWTEPERRAVLAHELAHIKRGDDRLAWLGLTVTLLQWHNPLVHWAFRQWKQAEEDAADALALATLGGGAQARRDLAGAILQTLELLRHANQSERLIHPSLRMISTLADARALKQRVANISRFSMGSYQSRQYRGPALITLCLMVFPLGVLIFPHAMVSVQAEAGEIEIATLNQNTGQASVEKDAIEAQYREFMAEWDEKLAQKAAQMESLNRREAELAMKCNRVAQSIRDYPALAEDLKIARDHLQAELHEAQKNRTDLKDEILKQNRAFQDQLDQWHNRLRSAGFEGWINSIAKPRKAMKNHSVENLQKGQIEGSLEERVMAMEAKMELIQNELHELRLRRASRLAEKKARSNTNLNMNIE